MFYLALAFLAAYVVGGLHTTHRLGQLSSSLAAELGGKVRSRSGNIALISGRDLGPAIAGPVDQEAQLLDHPEEVRKNSAVATRALAFLLQQPALEVKIVDLLSPRGLAG